MERSIFKIGDSVKVKNSGHSYAHFTKMFEQLNFINKKKNSFNKEKKDNTLYNLWRIHSIVPHLLTPGILVFHLKNRSNDELLIDEKGIRHSIINYSTLKKNFKKLYKIH